MRKTAALFLIFALSVSAAYAGKESSRKPEKRHVNPAFHWFRNSYFRPVKHFFSLRRGFIPALLGHKVEATDVDADGEVPDSDFYVNRDIAHLSPADVARGANTDDGPVGRIKFLRRKKSGASPGFFGEDERGVGYLFKCDRDDFPEMITGAEIVGNRLMWVLGYNVPESYITTIRGTGTNFDGRRAVAIRLVPGEILGPMDFKKSRDLREVRALKVASAWINNTDIKELNTLVTWRNGRVVRYLIDFSNCLGSHTIAPKSPKAGWEYSFDLGAGLIQLLTLNLIPRPYDPREKPFSKAVGLFNSNFDPDAWKPNYPVVPFWDMTREDAEWMARKIGRVSDELIRAAVAAAHYSRKSDADYIVRVLAERREVIVRRYLGGSTSPR